MRNVSKQDVKKIAVDFVRKKRKEERISVSYIEQKKDVWIVQGTCPIDLEGHPWTEKFEVVVDQRGNVTSNDFSLL
ncbi:MAG: hypothetical protein PVH12_05180 [Candidatus Bathyarchaeota archaeon]|jgi:hypothetical protein